MEIENRLSIQVHHMAQLNACWPVAGAGTRAKFASDIDLNRSGAEVRRKTPDSTCGTREVSAWDPTVISETVGPMRSSTQPRSRRHQRAHGWLTVAAEYSRSTRAFGGPSDEAS